MHSTPGQPYKAKDYTLLKTGSLYNAIPAF